jgi:hypothetical protein
VALIEGQIPIPGRSLLSDPARLVRQKHRNGESLNGIARELNRRLIHAKNAGQWQANKKDFLRIVTVLDQIRA